MVAKTPEFKVIAQRPRAVLALPLHWDRCSIGRRTEGGDHDYDVEVAFGSDDAPPIFYLGFVVRDPRDLVGGAAFFRPADRMGRRYHSHRRDRLTVLCRPH